MEESLFDTVLALFYSAITPVHFFVVALMFVPRVQRWYWAKPGSRAVFLALVFGVLRLTSAVILGHFSFEETITYYWYLSLFQPELACMHPLIAFHLPHNIFYGLYHLLCGCVGFLVTMIILLPINGIQHAWNTFILRRNTY